MQLGWRQQNLDFEAKSVPFLNKLSGFLFSFQAFLSSPPPPSKTPRKQKQNLSQQKQNDPMFGCFPFLRPQGIPYTAYKSFRNLNSGVYLGLFHWKVFFYLTPTEGTFLKCCLL